MRKKLFNYMGSKTQLLKTLYSHFPTNHLEMKYCEPFGGSGVVLFNKSKSIMEIYNDYSKGISAIFWCLINEFEKLCFRLQFAQQSEAIYQWFNDSYDPQTKLDLAVKTIYRIHFAYSGKEDTTFSRWPLIAKDGNFRQNRYILYEMNLFTKWRERFLHVQIYSEDFEKFIHRTDQAKTFYYCDPPYIIAKSHYKHIFKFEDHERLAKVLSTIKGKFLLSYDDYPLIRDLYQDFEMKEVNLKYYAGVNGRDKLRTELLISNYKLPKRQKLTEFIKIEEIEVLP